MTQEEQIEKAAENIAQNLYDYAKRGREPEYNRYDEGYLDAIDFQGSYLVKEGIEWALNNQWISVDDELPEYGEFVLVTDSDVCFVSWREKGLDETDHEFSNSHPCKITHWMKIPPLNN